LQRIYNGCTAETTFVIPVYSSDCISLSYDNDLADEITANSTSLKNDVHLLAKGMATVMNNSTVKNLVKTIALNNPDPSKLYFCRLSVLSDSCLAHSINLIPTIQTNLKNNGVSNADTARFRTVFASITISGVSPSATIYPEIYFNYLDPINQDSSYSAWDSVSVDYVVPSSMNGSNTYSCFYLSGGTLSNTSLDSVTIATKLPVWQITLNTNFINGSGHSKVLNNTVMEAPCNCEDPRRRNTKCIPTSGGQPCPRERRQPCKGKCIALVAIITD